MRSSPQLPQGKPELAMRAWLALGALAREVWPRLRPAARLGVSAAGALRVAGAAAGRQALRRRSSIAFALTRAAWWTSLWLWFVAGSAFFDVRAALDGSWLAQRILVGFALCAFVLAFANESRMRWSAWSLGLGHGVLGLLALTISGA